MLIDAHAHLDLYDDSLESALDEIRRHEILTISNSMDPASYARNLDIGRRCDLVLPIFGVHPWSAPRYADRLEDLNDAIAASPMLGEIGLDFHFVADASQYPAQRTVFEFFLRAARAQDKIVNVHTTGAERQILDLLNRHGIGRAIIHWYSGPLDVFRELVALGAYFTVGAEVFRSPHIRAIARELPGRQLLVETDNPGGPKWLGMSGTPALIMRVVQSLAELRETTAEAMAQTVRDNFLELARGDPRLAYVLSRVSMKQE
jgi:TatD DNase family protein